MPQSCERFHRTACPQKWPPRMLAEGVSEPRALTGCSARRGQRLIGGTSLVVMFHQCQSGFLNP